jgi:type II secretory pathway pseudopilin PulG
LATLVIVTYNGIQQKARDTKRKTDINAIQSQIEAYFAQNAKYPTMGNLNNVSNWRTTNMKGLDGAALQDPNGPAQALVAGAGDSKDYGIDLTPGGCDNGTNGDCVGYTLTAHLEGGGTYVKTAMN